jgi:hypothetical protein
MPTIIIADGLTKEFLGAEQPFAASPFNVGGAEIDRRPKVRAADLG